MHTYSLGWTHIANLANAAGKERRAEAVARQARVPTVERRQDRFGPGPACRV